MSYRYQNSAAFTWQNEQEPHRWCIVLPVSKYDPSSPVYSIAVYGVISKDPAKRGPSAFCCIPKNLLECKALLKEKYDLKFISEVSGLEYAGFLEKSTGTTVQELDSHYQINDINNPADSPFLKLDPDNPEELLPLFKILIPDPRVRKCILGAALGFDDCLKQISNDVYYHNKERKTGVVNAAPYMHVLPERLEKSLHELEKNPPSLITLGGMTEAQQVSYLESVPFGHAFKN